MDGMRADLVAAKRQVALAEKEAETAQRQLQQREAEIASTHRSLLKLDDVKCVAARRGGARCVCAYLSRLPSAVLCRASSVA